MQINAEQAESILKISREIGNAIIEIGENLKRGWTVFYSHLPEDVRAKIENSN